MYPGEFERNHRGMLVPSVADRLKRRARGLLVLLGAALVASVVRAAVPPQGASSPSANDPIIAPGEGKPIRLSEVQEIKRRDQERYENENGKAAPRAVGNIFMRIG